MKRIIVTGASSGIGKATAIYYLDQSDPVDIWMIARNTTVLKDIGDLYKDTPHTIRYSSVDVRQRESVQAWMSEVTQAWDDCQLLINNAGLALGIENFTDADPGDWDTMIDTNVKGLLYVSHAVLPLIRKSSAGRHIINIGSTAGKMVYENGHVYCATKYAVDALSQGMRIDLLRYGIKVTNINPGMVNTNFSLVRHKGNAERAQGTYNGYKVLSAEDIAQIIYFASALPVHVNINDLTVTCIQQANSVYKLPDNELMQE